MPGFEHGFNRAVQGFFSGLAIGAILKSFSSVGLLDKQLVSALLMLLGLASLLDIASKMKYWSTTYILGFLAGYFTIAYTFGIDVLTAMIAIVAICIVTKRIIKNL